MSTAVLVSAVFHQNEAPFHTVSSFCHPLTLSKESMDSPVPVQSQSSPSPVLVQSFYYQPPQTMYAIVGLDWWTGHLLSCVVIMLQVSSTGGKCTYSKGYRVGSNYQYNYTIMLVLGTV